MVTFIPLMVRPCTLGLAGCPEASWTWPAQRSRLAWTSPPALENATTHVFAASPEAPGTWTSASRIGLDGGTCFHPAGSGNDRPWTAIVEAGVALFGTRDCVGGC